MTVRTESRIRPSSLIALAIVIALLLAITACGDDEDTAAGSAGGGDGEMTVEITSPTDGTEVDTPFELEVEASVELGETDTGLHHIHVHYDGDAEDYDIVYGDSTSVERDLPAGEHTVQVVVANADHSETDASDQITISTGEGGGSGDDSPTTDDPYGY